MTNLEKFVMVPEDKYRRLTAGAETPRDPAPEKETGDAKEEGDENMIAPPPGMPEKPAVRWLTLPETE